MRMTSDPKGRSDSSGLLAVIGIGGAMVLCCAGPVLLAAGAAGVLGGALRSGWLILVAVGLVVAAVVLAVHRGRRGSRDSGSSAEGSILGPDGDSCCPPRRTSEPLGGPKGEQK